MASLIFLIVLELLLLLLLLLLCQYISAKRVRIYNSTIRIKKKKQIKTRSKDPVEDIAVLSAGTIFVIRQKLA